MSREIEVLSRVLTSYMQIRNAPSQIRSRTDIEHDLDKSNSVFAQLRNPLRIVLRLKTNKSVNACKRPETSRMLDLVESYLMGGRISENKQMVHKVRIAESNICCKRLYDSEATATVAPSYVQTDSRRRIAEDAESDGGQASRQWSYMYSGILPKGASPEMPGNSIQALKLSPARRWVQRMASKKLENVGVNLFKLYWVFARLSGDGKGWMGRDGDG
ncbi:hypothetical protein BDN70DRAFT_901830 [Pholiota conissans]|uniref:Uncharacterized protein n=1 Tax=Pholiota conissans TaxID=109636 RepID=A0A9P5YL51_9AGAR|nr:hypothetical protein BDN70DRAFT_901830 [Pholiota conissans]